MQLSILFTAPRPHQKENNPESQAVLNKRTEHFSAKCRLLLTRLMNGEHMKFADEVKTIGDLRRRALDLIESGIDVKREFLNGENVKTYYLEQKEIERIKNVKI